jgi:hypothetical protein
LKYIYSALNPCIPHKESSGDNIPESIKEIQEKCSPREDGSSHWKVEEELDTEIDEKIKGTICECGELLTSTIVLSITLVLIIIADSVCLVKKKWI